MRSRGLFLVFSVAVLLPGIALAVLGTRALMHERRLAAYVRSILAGGSGFDRFVAGDRAALSAQEQAGLDVFRGKGNCVACHVGPTLSDGLVHNTGVAWRNGQLTDVGAGAGRVRTPTLREITRTAPYMHDGSIATLEAVIDHYDRGGNRHEHLDPRLRPLGLSPEAKQSLRAFLGALEGEVREGITYSAMAAKKVLRPPS